MAIHSSCAFIETGKNSYVIITAMSSLYFLPLYLVVVYYANSVFFFFFYSRAAVSVFFWPCCPVQVLSFTLCLHHVFLSEQIKMMMMIISH